MKEMLWQRGAIRAWGGNQDKIEGIHIPFKVSQEKKRTNFCSVILATSFLL